MISNDVSNSIEDIENAYLDAERFDKLAFNSCMSKLSSSIPFDVVGVFKKQKIVSYGVVTYRITFMEVETDDTTKS